MVAALDKEGKLENVSIRLMALETYLSSELLREACKKSFITLENIYAEKLIESGFSKETARELGMVIQLMIEGAITTAVTKKYTFPLLAVSRQINILIKTLYLTDRSFNEIIFIQNI